MNQAHENQTGAKPQPGRLHPMFEHIIQQHFPGLDKPIQPEEKAKLQCRDCRDPIDPCQGRDYSYRCPACYQQLLREMEADFRADAAANQMEQDWTE